MLNSKYTPGRKAKHGPLEPLQYIVPVKFTY